ncbi:hypothetical protein L3X38_017453 [Prunus dulcis]|uniref:Uncharacterized protein n=1 Tax=Prunus dulcis TaxID=3755 RepID=A0AAD4Z958_PRUDU|nr:hypothetical protein L3X38_017453 [Prunus dulcis]
MAPQVTVYFHKLAAGSPKRVSHRVTFTVDHAPVVNDVPKANPKIKTSKAFVKVTKTQLMKSPSKNSIRNARKRAARAFKKKTTQANSFELIEIILVVAVETSASKTAKSTRCKVNGSITSLTAMTPIITQIMIGSIPITLTTTESVMVEVSGPSKSKEGSKKQTIEVQDHLTPGASPKSLIVSRPYTGPATRARARALSLQSPEAIPLQRNKSDCQEQLITQFQGLHINEESESFENMPVMVTGTTSADEQLLDMQRKLAESEAEVAALTAQLIAKVIVDSEKKDEERKEEEVGESSTSQITHQDIKTLIAEGIREFQMSISPPILGYRKPYPAHYDAFPFPKGYQKLTFDKFDGMSGSPHEHLAHFSSACGETSQSDALLIRQFVQSLKGSAFTCLKKKVSHIDLAKTTQKPGESANDFIMR